MRHNIYIILLLTYCSSQGQSNYIQDKKQSKDSLQINIINSNNDILLSIPFLDNFFLSCNATSSNIYADTLFSEEIDKFLKNLQTDPKNEHWTTSGDMLCYYQAIEKLDTLINLTYKNVYRRLKTISDKELFKTSQDMWRKYFNSERTFLHEIYWTKTKEYHLGREHSIVQAQWTFQIARQRLILLKNIDDQIYD